MGGVCHCPPTSPEHRGAGKAFLLVVLRAFETPVRLKSGPKNRTQNCLLMQVVGTSQLAPRVPDGQSDNLFLRPVKLFDDLGVDVVTSHG